MSEIEPKSFPPVIGFCGLAGSGKDTAASILVKHFGYTRVSFADHLKDVVAMTFDFERALLEGDSAASRQWRDTPLTHLGLTTPREILQRVGTNMRQIDPDIWVRRALNIDQHKRRVVVTDVRFPNEAEAIKKAGGHIYSVMPATLPNWALALLRSEDVFHNAHDDDMQAEFELHNLPPVHESEWRQMCRSFHSLYVDGTMMNNATLESFQEAVEDYFRTHYRELH